MREIVFDTETTGLKDPHLVEAAWLKIADISGLAVTSEFLNRYKPGKPIELGALVVSHILDEGGYYSPSLVLKMRLLPGEGWEFECLTSLCKGMIRKPLAKAHTADELLRVLREKVTVPNPQLT